MARSRAAVAVLCLAATGAGYAYGGNAGVLGLIALVFLAALAAAVVWVRPLWPDALLLLVPLAAFEWSEGYLQPFVVVSMVGGGGVAWLLRSRLRIQAELVARAAELEGEREDFVREAVRYERGRIARELHDVVAHNVSMVVVQAAAAQRVLEREPAFAEEAIREIARATADAAAEVDALAELLGTDVLPVDRALGDLLDELAERATRAGLRLQVYVEGSLPTVPNETVDVVHRAIQEAVTNALKHAPGAPVTVRLSAAPNGLRATVRNGPGAVGALHGTGGGFGHAGIRERAAAVGGHCTFGATEDGGWAVSLEVPAL